MDYFFSIILLIVLAVREMVFYKERQDMLDRLMSRNLDNYKANNTKPEEDDNFANAVDPDLLDLSSDEARKEILDV